MSVQSTLVSNSYVYLIQPDWEGGGGRHLHVAAVKKEGCSPRLIRYTTAAEGTKRNLLKETPHN